MRPFTRSTVVAFLCLCLAGTAWAKMPGQFGVRAGVNLSAFGGDFGDAVNPEHRVAPNLALVYEHALSPQLAFHGEVGYSGKGGKIEGENTDVFGNPNPYKIEWRFDYIEVPLLLRGRFGSIGKVTPYFELGPSIGITLAGKIEDDPAIIGEEDIKSDMNAFDLGWGAGAGVEFAAGPGRIGLEARYTRGFSGLFSADGNFETINQAWTFALSYAR